MSKEIDTLITQLVNDKTFSLEAVDAIKKIKEEHATLLTTYERVANTTEGYKNLLNRQENTIVDYRNKVATLEKEVADFKLRESKIQRLELQAEFAELRRSDSFELVRLVFKSPVFRKTVTENNQVPYQVTYPGGESGSMTAQTTANKTEVEEES